MRVPLEGPPARMTPFVLGMAVQGGGGVGDKGEVGGEDMMIYGNSEAGEGELIPDPELSQILIRLGTLL